MRPLLLGTSLVVALFACGGSGDGATSSAAVTAEDASAPDDPATRATGPATTSAPVGDAGAAEDAASHDPNDPSTSDRCLPSPTGSFSFDTVPDYFASLKTAYDVAAEIPDGAGTTGGLTLLFESPTLSYDEGSRETWTHGNVEMTFRSDALGAGTHDGVIVDGGDASTYCASDGTGGGTGGTAANVGTARVTITTRSATLVEGTVDFVGGGHLAFHAPVLVKAQGPATSCCPKTAPGVD